MRAKILKWGFLALILVGFAILLNHHRISKPNTSNSTPTPESVGVPVRIKIAGINLDAVIEQVGVAADGSMDVPKSPNNTAWYKLGPRPGEIGSSVIDGHVDWINGARAVFTDLDKLKPGDKISIEDDQGKTISFVMRESKTYAPNADASEVFVSNDGKAHLNLITCSGVWDNATKGFTKRLVVFADRE